MSVNPIDKVERELSWERKYGDGLGWIANGLFAFLIVLGFNLEWPVWILGMVPMIFIQQYIRKHYITPRIGTAKLKIRPKLSSVIFGILLGLLALAVVLALGFWLLREPRTTPLNLLALSICIAILVSLRVWPVNANWDGKSIYPLMDSVLILIFLLLLFWLKPNRQTLSLYLVTYGIFNLSYGLVTLVRFINNNPVIPDEE